MTSCLTLSAFCRENVVCDENNSTFILPTHLLQNFANLKSDEVTLITLVWMHYWESDCVWISVVVNQKEQIHFHFYLIHYSTQLISLVTSDCSDSNNIFNFSLLLYAVCWLPTSLDINNHTHTHTHARTHACTHTHARTHMHTHHTPHTTHHTQNRKS